MTTVIEEKGFKLSLFQVGEIDFMKLSPDIFLSSIYKSGGVNVSVGKTELVSANRVQISTSFD